jgi:hypothetical protein
VIIKNMFPLIDALNEVRSRGVFLSNKIIRTAVFTGKQPQAFWSGTRQGPKKIFLDRTGPSSDQSEPYFGNHYITLTDSTPPEHNSGVAVTESALQSKPLFTKRLPAVAGFFSKIANRQHTRLGTLPVGDPQGFSP